MHAQFYTYTENHGYVLTHIYTHISISVFLVTLVEIRVQKTHHNVKQVEYSLTAFLFVL